MSAWLDPVHSALDRVPQPVTFFFRNDDAGWEDRRLFELLDLFHQFAAPIDLAVIPEALQPHLAGELRRRAESNPAVGLHQHGFAHVNHELEGRKCEFGAARDPELQRRDIARGRELLAEQLGGCVDSIFTPPWNRCTRQTGECLTQLGFAALSRESGAAPLEVDGLAELPIHVDWFARRKGVHIGREEWALQLAGRLTVSSTVGIMFHHGWMDAEERDRTGQLLHILTTHSQSQCSSMRSLVAQPVGTHR